MMKSVPFWLIVLLAWIIGGAWYYNSKCCAVPGEQSLSFLIKDGRALKAESAFPLLFGNSADEPITPLAEEVTSAFDRTATYLKGHPDRLMTIEGHYTSNEANPSMFENLGLARANRVKNMFTDRGVPAVQLATIGLLKDSLNIYEGNVANGITYAFTGAPVSETTSDGSNDAAAALASRITNIESRFRANPLRLYFETNSGSLNLSQNQRQALGDLVWYLDNKSGSSLKISGHTDNVGERSSNMALGERRANFIKSYLQRNGVKANALSVTSKGPDSPIDTNDSDSGRAKNRRVDISL